MALTEGVYQDKGRPALQADPESLRLYYLDDIPTPYRLSVFHQIRKDWPGAFKVAFCAAAEPGRSWTFDTAGLDVEVLQGRQYRPEKQINPFSFKWNHEVFRSLRAFRPDVVVMSGYIQPTCIAAALWCLKNGVPYGISSETSARSSSVSGMKWYAKRATTGWLVKGMSFGLPVGREAASYLRALGGTQAPMAYFPNTPDAASIAQRAQKVRAEGDGGLLDSLSIPKNRKIILFVGRLIDAKRPMDVLQAFESVAQALPDTVLVIAGDGPLRPVLTQAAQGNPRIIFTGWMSDPAKTAALMALASVMVLPSAHEPWGAVVNESMAAGTPVIASDMVGAATELIDHGQNGMIVKAGDMQAISAALQSMLKSESLLADMSAKAQSRALEQGHFFAAGNLVRAARQAVIAARARRKHGSV